MGSTNPAIRQASSIEEITLVELLFQFDEELETFEERTGLGLGLEVKAEEVQQLKQEAEESEESRPRQTQPRPLIVAKNGVYAYAAVTVPMSNILIQ